MIGSSIQGFAEHLTRLESQHLPGGYLYLTSSLGVSAPAGFLFLNGEIAESRNFNFFSAGETVLYDFKNGLHNDR